MLITARDNLTRPPHERVAKVYVDEVDVTRDCCEVDADAGVATVFVRGPGGSYDVRGGVVATREIRGTVRLEYEADAPERKD